MSLVGYDSESDIEDSGTSGAPISTATDTKRKPRTAPVKEVSNLYDLPAFRRQKKALEESLKEPIIDTGAEFRAKKASTGFALPEPKRAKTTKTSFVPTSVKQPAARRQEEEDEIDGAALFGITGSSGSGAGNKKRGAPIPESSPSAVTAAPSTGGPGSTGEGMILPTGRLQMAYESTYKTGTGTYDSAQSVVGDALGVDESVKPFLHSRAMARELARSGLQAEVTDISGRAIHAQCETVGAGGDGRSGEDPQMGAKSFHMPSRAAKAKGQITSLAFDMQRKGGELEDKRRRELSRRAETRMKYGW